jgi:hypothetical protein
MVPGGKQATSLKEAQQCGVERQKVEGVAVAVTHAVVSLEHAINVFEEVNSTERMMDDKLRSFRDGEGNVTDQVRSARPGRARQTTRGTNCGSCSQDTIWTRHRP